MTNNQIKEKIASAYEASTPNVLEKIKETCEQTPQSDYITNITMIKERRVNWGQLAAMVAALVMVSLISLKLGQMTAPVATVENKDVQEEVIAGTSNELKQQGKVEIEVEPGIKVTVDENLTITGAVAENKAVEKKLKEQGIVGMDAASGLELIHKLMKEISSPEEIKQENKKEEKKDTENKKPVTKVDNTKIIDSEKPSEQPVEKEVEKTLNEVEKITDTTTDIVEDISKTTTNIIDDAADTTGKVLDDVEDSVDKIFKIFK